jgi:hypothetical protein
MKTNYCQGVDERLCMIRRRVSLNGNGDNLPLLPPGFVAGHPELILEQPACPCNERDLPENFTHRPGRLVHRK